MKPQIFTVTACLRAVERLSRHWRAQPASVQTHESMSTFQPHANLNSWFFLMPREGHIPPSADAEDHHQTDVVRPDQAAGDRGLVQRHQPTDHEEAAQHCFYHRWRTDHSSPSTLIIMFDITKMLSYKSQKHNMTNAELIENMKHNKVGESGGRGARFLFRPLILHSSVFGRSSAAGQSDHLQLGPPCILDQPDRRVALQDFLDYPLFGRDRRSVRPGHS